MRKFFAGILLAQALFCLNLKAQTTDVLRDELNMIFQHIDKSQIPTGYLDEYGPGFVPLASFNGQLSDSNRYDFDSWQIIYGQIRASKIYGTTGLPTLSNAISSIKMAGNHSAGLFAVPLLLMDYSVLNPYAVQQNLFTVSNNQVYDVPGRTQSPYQQKLLFGATPVVNYTNTGTVQVLFKPDLFYTNTNKTISTIQVDFNDQNGYITVPLNTAFTKTYTDTGYKRWKIKLTCTDNSSYQCYAPFYVKEVVINNNIAGRYGDNPDLVEQDFPAVPGPGSFAHSGGKVTVWFSKKGIERTLNKPFIIVEGYDASDVAPSLKDRLDYKSLLFLLREQPGTYDFVSDLDDLAGYDLVFLDFKNGTDNILRNVALFKEVLGWVNTQKASAPNPEDNVILGLSMGGLVIRYALAEMTKNNIPHGTRLIISHDSPHQGANTPLGLQYMTRFLATRGGIGGFVLNELDMIREGNDLLNEPASEQLLIYKATSPTTYTANTFLAGTYRNMITFGPNDPIPTYKFIAVASGSECGVSLFAAGSDIVNIQAGVLLPVFAFSGVLLKFEAIVKALPASGSPANIAHLKIYRTISLFFGAIQKEKILEELNAFSPAGALPWDGAPGGTVDVAEKLKVKPFEIIIPLGIALTGAGFFVQEKICFVPNTSSLDITNVNSTALTASYVGGVSPGNPSRAENFKAQEQFSTANGTAYNTGHRFFTAKNANWLFNEMEGIIPNDLNCSSSCQPAFNIIGDAELCTSKTYSFDQIPANGTINWSLTPSGIASLVANSDKTVTLTKQQNGKVTLTGSTTFCGTTVIANKEITVGTLTPTIQSVTYFGNEVGLTALSIPDATYNWYEGGILTESGGSNTYITDVACNTTKFIQVEAVNTCGTSSKAGKGVSVKCSSGEQFRLAPNPVSSTLTVLVNESVNQLSSSSVAGIHEIRIFDKFGTLKKSMKYPNGTKSVTINTTQLPTDIYSIQIYNGTAWDIQQLVVEH